MRSVALLIVRLVLGGLMAGHGAQKLFGSFEGPGLRGTAGMMEKMGMRPGKLWARTAGLSEFGGGLLTALGLFHPLGPVGIISAMTMATAKAHWGKPIWVTSGGAELPVVNSAVALAVMLSGPGSLSLDHAFGLRLPNWMSGLAMVGAATAVAYGLTLEPKQEPMAEEASQEKVAETTAAALPA
jgi:putative oxidoreductase